MPFASRLTPDPPETERLPSDALRAAYAALAPLDGLALLSTALKETTPGRLATVSSFGAESAVLLDLVARVDPATPVIFLETGMHFRETRAYRDLLIDRLGLRDVRIWEPDEADRRRVDPSNALWARNPDACCDMRKVRPLDRALAGFDGWISGRKRFHGAARTTTPSVEIEPAPRGAARLKLNPLAGWSASDLAAYFARYGLPRHPLWAAGYPSVGCAPCTAKPAAGDTDPRAGRWAGRDKTECGIHRRGA
ncbi:MAG: phosphoadenylyl-sulfate reductase [Marivibrio sp.]|uniref:phosphoadenylyl-sulfate reductase n=1 Tax=Marivibrio sp. TaxID=2039719 RepID=UPI0032EADC62